MNSNITRIVSLIFGLSLICPAHSEELHATYEFRNTDYDSLYEAESAMRNDLRKPGDPDPDPTAKLIPYVGLYPNYPKHCHYYRFFDSNIAEESQDFVSYYGSQQACPNDCPPPIFGPFGYDFCTAIEVETMSRSKWLDQYPRENQETFPILQACEHE